MAISAFRQGKLKKNPLLGTSLAVDPGRESQRQDFMSLYGEAKEKAGGGRAGMLGELSERFKQFGGPEVARLDVIKGRQQELSDEAQGLDYSSIKTAQDRMDSLRRAQEVGAETDWNIWGAPEGSPQADPGYQEFISEWKYQPGSGTGFEPSGGGKTTLTPEAYMTETYMPREMGAAQTAYDTAYEGYTSKLGILGQRSATLSAEQKEREGKLSQRAGLYNMFLGA